MVGGSPGSRVRAETAELLGVSVKCVRAGAEGVRASEEAAKAEGTKDEETKEDDEEPDCHEGLEGAMACCE